MKYTQSISQSAENLRLIIPLISKHKIAANPITFTVLYEFVSGANAKLVEEIDTLLEKGQAITDELIEILHKKHILEYDEESVKHFYTETLRTLLSLSESTAQTGEQTSRFTDALEGYISELKYTKEREALRQIVKGLLNDSGSMQEYTSSLKAQLEESKSEIDNLRTELKQAKQETLTDALTRLYNRNGFTQALKQSISNKPTNSFLCLLMADIDHFKQVNDTYGHLIGDQVIRFVASILKHQTKGKDITARFGGEEFAVLLVETTLMGARSVAENIRNAIETAQLRRKGTQEAISKVTISIGVARYQSGESFNEFIERADSALYESKKQGRNQVTVDET